MDFTRNFNSNRNTLYFMNGKIFKRYFHDGEPTRYYVSKDGEVYSDISKRILKPNHTLKGYTKLGIFLNGAKKAIPVTVHKMVGKTFHLDQWQEGYDIDHINGIKDDNRADNLEWVSRSENIKRAFKNGLKHGIRGNNNPVTVYSDELIHQACKYLEQGISIKKVAKKVQIPLSYLYTIVRGESRNDIVSQYTIPEKIYSVSRFHFTKKQEKKILKLRKQGLTAKEILAKIGGNFSVNQVYNVFYKKS